MPTKIDGPSSERERPMWVVEKSSEGEPEVVLNSLELTLSHLEDPRSSWNASATYIVYIY